MNEGSRAAAAGIGSFAEADEPDGSSSINRENRSPLPLPLPGFLALTGGLCRQRMESRRGSAINGEGLGPASCGRRLLMVLVGGLGRCLQLVVCLVQELFGVSR